MVTHIRDAGTRRPLGLYCDESAGYDAEITAAVLAEDALAEPDRYGAVLARLRSWLALPADEAYALGRAWERSLPALPREVQDRTRDTELAVAMNALTFEDFRALSALRPRLLERAAPVPEALAAAA